MGREKIAVIAMFAALVSCAVELPDPIVRFAMETSTPDKGSQITLPSRFSDVWKMGIPIPPTSCPRKEKPIIEFNT